MSINKPIFIVGSGRSGTTVLYNLLSTHPEVCWFSNYSDKLHAFRIAPILHRVLDFPFIGTVAKKGIIEKSNFCLKPSEAEHIYHKHCGFLDSVKSTEADFNPLTVLKFKKSIQQHLSLSGKNRFISKQTSNNQRIRLINSIFDDAYYIHIIRDGRAVANSMLNVSWWNDIDIWWLGGNKASTWTQQGNPAIELCGLHWKQDVEEILDHKNLFAERYLEIRYDDFRMDVRGTMSKITDFCELKQSRQFMELLPQTLPNMDTKWEKYLSDEQKDNLERSIGPFLKQLGYA